MSEIYLAARYSRRLELCMYREELRRLGYIVPARWLNGGHQVDNDGRQIGEAGEALVEGGDPLAAKFANDDLEDVAAADTMIAFTESPRTDASGRGRGGRHVELGLAIAWAKRIIVCGPRENVFCWLPIVEHAETWPEALDLLAAVPIEVRGG